MRLSKITTVLVAGLLLAAQVSAFAQGDRPSSGGASPSPAAEVADAPAKAATPNSESSMMKGGSANPAAGEPFLVSRAAAAGPLALGHVPARRYHREGGHDRPCGGFARHLDGLGSQKASSFLAPALRFGAAYAHSPAPPHLPRRMRSCAARQVRWRNVCRRRQTRSGSPPICAPMA